MDYNKVICIGFQKTGTSSLGDALEILGFKTHGPFGWNNENIKKEALNVCLDKSQEYDAFQDFPWAILYKKLDIELPRSKFILTVRDKDEWYNSVLKHFGTRSTPMRKWVYGKPFPRWNKEEYVHAYENHIEDVNDYFKDRSEDLLTMNITSGDGWEKLCPFLGLDIPNKSFPVTRTRNSRRINRVKRYINNPIDSVTKAAHSYKRTLEEILKYKLK